MPKKYKKTEPEYAYYIVGITNYYADFSISLADKKEDRPYDKHFTITIEGTIKITTSRKLSSEKPVSMILIRDDRKLDPDYKPLCVGTLSNYKNKIQGLASMTSLDLHHIYGLLTSGKAEVLDLYGHEMYRNKVTLTSIGVTTRFEWEDWAEDNEPSHIQKL